MARRWRQVKKEISKWCTTWTWQTNWRRREYPWPKVLDACLFIYKAIFKGRGGRIKWHHKNMAKTSVEQSRKWIKTNFLRNAHTPWSGGVYNLGTPAEWQSLNLPELSTVRFSHLAPENDTKQSKRNQLGEPTNFHFPPLALPPFLANHYAVGQRCRTARLDPPTDSQKNSQPQMAIKWVCIQLWSK